MKGFGGVVTFEIDTDLEGAIRFIDATRIPYQAPSLDYTPEQRESWGITDSLVRLACGIEAEDDLIADIEQALTHV